MKHAQRLGIGMLVIGLPLSVVGGLLWIATQSKIAALVVIFLVFSYGIGHGVLKGIEEGERDDV